MEDFALFCSDNYIYILCKSPSDWILPCFLKLFVELKVYSSLEKQIYRKQMLKTKFSKHNLDFAIKFKSSKLVWHQDLRLNIKMCCNVDTSFTEKTSPMLLVDISVYSISSQPLCLIPSFPLPIAEWVSESESVFFL